MADSLQKRRQIVLVDDHPIVRHGLESLLAGMPEVVIGGSFDSGRELLAFLNQHPADLAIIDLSLQDTSGLELIKQLRSARRNLRILVCSMHDEEVYAERALHAGASGYVMKEKAGSILKTAVRTVLAGDIYLSEKMTSALLKRAAHGARSAGMTPLASLSDRELEIFRLIGAGKSLREIAELLTLSVKTVETHKANLKRKLGLKTTAQLLKYAIASAEEPPDRR